MLVKFKKLESNAKTPTKAFLDDAGWDIYAIADLYIPPNEQREVKTGIAFEIPKGWHIQIHTRSSYGKKMLKCHLGIVDSGYRNEVSIWVYNYGKEGYYVKTGDKVCQVLFLPVPEVNMKEVDQLSESDRGLKGHGSSGR